MGWREARAHSSPVDLSLSLGVLCSTKCAENVTRARLRCPHQRNDHTHSHRCVLQTTSSAPSVSWIHAPPHLSTMHRLARRPLRPARMFACLLCAHPFSATASPRSTSTSPSMPPPPSITASDQPSLSSSSPPAPRTPSLWRDGQFHNPWPSFKEKSVLHRLSDLLHYWADKRDMRIDPFIPPTYANHSFPPPYNVPRILPDVHLPMHCPAFDRLSSVPVAPSPSPPPIAYTWIGHATTLVQLPSLTIITDPWFSSRASAWQAVGPRRFRPPACTVEELPAVDVVLITHNHFDHCDWNSVVQLRAKADKEERRSGRICRWFVPKGMRWWLLRWGGVAPDRCVEMDWWQSHHEPATAQPTQSGAQYELTAVGAQHWSSRWALLDNRRSLWCGFVLQACGATVYYSGDSGYCPVFREIPAHLPEPDLSILPIGAYDPAWLLEGAHVSPEQAVQVHVDVRSRQSFAVHWGTVVLSNEMVMEPRVRLDAEVKRKGMREDEFITTHHGETVIVRRGQAVLRGEKVEVMSHGE